MQPQIHQFNNADRQWLSKSLSRGNEICGHYRSEKILDAGELDRHRLGDFVALCEKMRLAQKH